MRTVSKQVKFVIVSAILICIVITVYTLRPKQEVIKIGISSGSRWDVPNSSADNAFDDAIEQFEKKHKRVKIIYESGIRKKDYEEWLSDKLLNGQSPDVYMVPDNDFYRLVNQGALVDLTGYLSEDQKKDFYPVALETAKVKRNLYALPIEANPVMMCVNTDLLKKENINIPNNNWTLEDFIKICKQLKKNNHGYYGVSGYTWKYALAAYGGSLNGEDGNILIDSPSMYKALSFISDIKQIEPDKNVLQKDFDEGKVAFFPMTLAQYRTYKPYPYKVMKYSKLKWICIPLPTSSSKIKATPVKTTLMGVSKTSRHKEIAKEFVKFLSTDTDVQQNFMNQSQGSSVLKKVVKNKGSQNKALGDKIGTGILTLNQLDNMLNNSVSDFTFSCDRRKFERIDYLINLSIEKETTDSSLPSIQEEINRKW